MLIALGLLFLALGALLLLRRRPRPGRHRA
jgi:LPXTG-motif cell wall-anchored protein